MYDLRHLVNELVSSSEHELARPPSSSAMGKNATGGSDRLRAGIGSGAVEILHLAGQLVNGCKPVTHGRRYELAFIRSSCSPIS